MDAKTQNWSKVVLFLSCSATRSTPDGSRATGSPASWGCSSQLHAGGRRDYDAATKPTTTAANADDETGNAATSDGRTKTSTDTIL